MTSTERRRPPGRYDEPRRTSRVLVVLVAVVFGGLVTAGGVALYLRHTEGSVPYELRGYAVSSATSVKVSWEVKLSRGVRAQCQLKARGDAGQQVGLEVVDVGPGTGGTQVVEHVLTTTERARTAEVRACREVPAP